MSTPNPVNLNNLDTRYIATTGAQPGYTYNIGSSAQSFVRPGSWDPRAFGAKVDGVYLSDVSIATGSASLTSVASTFVAADVGKLITVTAAGTPTTIGTTSASYDTSTARTSIFLSSNLSATVYYGPLLLISGSNYQVIQGYGSVSGANSILTASFTPTYAFPAGTTVAIPTNFATTIASVSGSTATLAASAGQAVASGVAVYGSDDTAGWNAVLTAAGTLGGEVHHPGGVSLATSTINVPGGVTLSGVGIDYSSNVTGNMAANVGPGNPQRGSVIRAHGTFSASAPLVKVGSVAYPNTGWGASGNTAGSLTRIALDAGSAAQSACQTLGPRSRLSFCEFRNGVSYALDMSGQNTMMTNCVSDNASQGIATVYINAHDCKVNGPGEIRPGGLYGLLISANAGNSQVQGQDIFNTINSNVVNYVVYITATAAFEGITLINNNIDSTSNGSIIGVKVSTGMTMYGLNISNNRVYNGGGTPWFVLFDLPSSGNSVIGLTINGNNMTDVGNVSYAVSGIAARKGSLGTILNSTVVGNSFSGSSVLFGGGFVPTTQHANVWKSTSGVYYQSSQESAATFSGDGALLSFTVNHLIGSVPSSIIISPMTAAAVGAYVSASTATTFTITFATAPASGTSNVKFNWAAKY